MKWKPAQINDKIKMTRPDGDAIAIRDLTALERVRYCYILIPHWLKARRNPKEGRANA